MPGFGSYRQNRGSIGIAIGQDGRPAKGIVLTAYPLGVPLRTALPATRTNEAGEYRFENLPWWGRYTFYAESEVRSRPMRSRYLHRTDSRDFRHPFGQHPV